MIGRENGGRSQWPGSWHEASFQPRYPGKTETYSKQNESVVPGYEIASKVHVEFGPAESRF